MISDATVEPYNIGGQEVKRRFEIEVDEPLDLRGFLGIDPSVPPGYERIHYTVTMKGDGSEADFREIHETVSARSTKP